MVRQLKKFWNSGSFAWNVLHWLTTRVSAASIIPKLKVTNHDEANKYVRRTYRKGFEVEGL